jgi:mono/diheme cytochrome c family protein
LPASPEKLPRFADPLDPSAPLAARARAYLHSNCAQCHVEAGGGNSRIDLNIDTPLAKTHLLDEKPAHHTFGLGDARLVSPGAPERSVLFHRVAMRGAGQMPQLATSIVDPAAVELLQAWIAGLEPAPRGQ